MAQFHRPHAKCLSVALYAIWFFFAITPARASEPIENELAERRQKLAEAAEKYVKPLAERAWTHAVVVGIVDESGRHVFGFGRRAADRPEAPDGDSLFEIGSVTKVFTGTLLADLVDRGMLSVEDPVNKFLPDDVPELRCGDRAMQLVDLATHSSGLPRIPANWKPKDATDPYADYSADDLHAFLKQHAAPSLGKSLGALFGGSSKPKWEYSNLGVGLLGHVLARKTGQSYEQLLVSQICEPLNMPSTRLTLDDALLSRLIAGHNTDGEVEKNWHFDCLAPCGGLRSSVNDLLTFVAANLELTDTPLKAAMRLARQPRYELGPKTSLGLNWFIKSDLVFHDGMTGGYCSFVGFSPAKKVGVVVLADTTVGGVSGLLNQASLALFKSLTEEMSPELPRIRATIPLDRALLEKYAGQYSLVPLISTFTITAEGDKLFAQLTGQARYRLYPESERNFFYKVADAQIDFELDDQGEVTHLVLHQNGKDMKAGRVKQSAPDSEKQPAQREANH